MADAGLLPDDHPYRYYTYSLVDPLDMPYATFRWYYRTWAQLEALGVTQPFRTPAVSESDSQTSGQAQKDPPKLSSRNTLNLPSPQSKAKESCSPISESDISPLVIRGLSLPAVPLIDLPAPQSSFGALIKRTISPIPGLKMNTATPGRFAQLNRGLREQICERLSTPSYVSFPGSPLFQSQQNGPGGYWSANEAEIVSSCRLAPRNAQEVSTAVKLLVQANCRFAVRGGGHMFWAGAANIQDGVTIDLSQMDRVVVSRNRKLTAVGAGARWQDVYSKLDPMNLSVVGGRVGSVGVSGLTLGGGNSYFAPRHGIACDGVASFQVVLANGQRVVASPEQHPDLYKALRGGGNNFGIVTQFTLRTFEQGRIWGGFILNPPNTTVENLQRLQEFNTESGNAVDRDATNNQVHLYNANGRSAVLNILVNTRPVENPEILRSFSTLQPQISNSMRITNLSEMVTENNPPSGLNYGVSYSNAADDELVYSTTRSYFEKVEQYTRSTGQHEPFIYMNYALPTQKVIESYGNVNGHFLRTVSRKYDPKQVFQRLVPGGFKLNPARPSEHGGPDSI
ncbi:MAG: hypothetical protein Q9221_000353 [Calogaya cf. arnoldii]